jgi:hypothetical protein
MMRRRVGPEETMRIIQARSRPLPEQLPVNALWVWAVVIAQDTGNLKPLAALLRADDLLELRRGEREVLAQIFDRGRFKKGRGLRFGTMSAEHKLKLAAEDVKKKQTEGQSRAEAIQSAARFWFENEKEPGRKLANYIDGRRGSTRRRRRHPPSKRI